jgi:hypothetical protein
VPKPLYDSSAFQGLDELMMMLQLDTDASKVITAPCEALLWNVLPTDASAAGETSMSISSSAVCYDLKNDESLVCELSRESDPACHQLYGAPSSVAHFDAYAAGCTKSTLNFFVDEVEQRDAAAEECAAPQRSIFTVLALEELLAHDTMQQFIRQTAVGNETDALTAPTDGIAAHRHDLTLLPMT